ncbi:alpha/beta hydrolase [Corynebacterium alimapuense]|uniref:Alpha/beta hydrolase n=1 Tax=Corynebacterium alimapuense TaxID=1576874 RepID=A0A3M8K840_9CORY|nr:alpha/beta hydrolase [Corynebacterium alimapuense]RNE49397.1 alpha/beta hydrolase [Corynebacterium alimapuense]
MSNPHVSQWREDILGPDFMNCEINFGPDPEGEGEAIASLVRYLPEGEPTPKDWASRRAILWVPGMTDYFFHAHLAHDLHEAGYAFYALDLRKCGRARVGNQRWHYSNDFRHYFPDLNAALDILSTEHSGVVPLAHSTGGLITALWADHLATNDSARHDQLDGIILNSPWLDMMYPRPLVVMGKPIVNLAGKLFPRLAIPGGNLGSYGSSLHISRHGTWEFDTVMKPLGGHPKYLGWLREVLRNQAKVHRNKIDVRVPVLTLCSAHSLLGKPYSAAADSADIVLDIEQIKRWAPQLGQEVTVRSIQGARHDVFLSTPYPLEEAMMITSNWLSRL